MTREDDDYYLRLTGEYITAIESDDLDALAALWRLGDCDPYWQQSMREIHEELRRE